MKLGGFSVTLGAVAALALLVVGASGTFAGPTPDSDSDGVKNLVDNCVDAPNGTNTQGLQVDSDRDGFGNQCDGDLNNSGGVNVTDFVLFGGAFGTNCGAVDVAGCADPAYDAAADLNSSGGVNVTDFVLFGAQFSAGVPGPSGLLCAINDDSSALQKTRYAGSQSGKNPCETLGPSGSSAVATCFETRPPVHRCGISATTSCVPTCPAMTAATACGESN